MSKVIRDCLIGFPQSISCVSGPENSPHVRGRSDSKLKPIAVGYQRFSALEVVCVFYFEFSLAVHDVVISSDFYCNYISFGFTTLI